MSMNLPHWLEQVIQLAGSAIEVRSEMDERTRINESSDTVFFFPKTGIVVVNRMSSEDPRKPFCDLVLQRESEADQFSYRSSSTKQRRGSSIADSLLPLLNGDVPSEAHWKLLLSELAADPSFRKKSLAPIQGCFIYLEIEGLHTGDHNQLEEIRVLLEAWSDSRGGLLSAPRILREAGQVEFSRWAVFLPTATDDKESDPFQEVQNWVDLIQTELFLQARAGYGTLCADLSDAYDCFEQSVFALTQGKRFRPNQRVYSYADLGIIHLLAELPKTSKQRYISQLLKGKADDLTPELKDTIWTFIKNDLRLTETARELYLHRNSLNYRIERIRDMLGLDIRTFEDAALLWICLHLLQEKRDLQEECPNAQIEKG